MFSFKQSRVQAVALVLIGILPMSAGYAEDDLIVVPTRKGSKAAQVEKVRSKSEDKTTEEDPNSDVKKSSGKTDAASAKKKKAEGSSKTTKAGDRKTAASKARKSEQAVTDEEKTKQPARKKDTASADEPVVAERAESFLTNMGRKGDVFNTDYKTRSGSADIPPALAGNGMNGRNLPIGGEDMYRLSGMPDDYMPTDLVLIPKQYSYTGQPVYLRKPAADSFIRMVTDAERQGLTIRIFSGYRDIKHQRRLYAEAVARSGKNQKGVARPGKSEHMLGTTADVTSTDRYLMKRSFAETPEGKWLSRHAPQYGWRMTVVRGEGPRAHVDEPWHIRYFGTGGREMVEEPQKREGLVRKTVKGIGKLFGLGR